MKRIIAIIVIFSVAFCIVGCNETQECSILLNNEDYSYTSEAPIKDSSWHCFNKQYLDELRTKYKLDDLVSDCSNDFEKVQAVTRWVSNLWQHDGYNKPKQNDPLFILDEVVENGEQFRCVEYGTVIYGCLTALDIKARTISLKTQDVETRASGAGHVATEAYLKDINKWIFIDGQWGAIPVFDDTPLNAVEFGQALNKPTQDKKLGLLCFKQGNYKSDYYNWINQYLYYFNTSYYIKSKNDDTIVKNIMLTPIDSKSPTIFQINSEIKMDTYTHSVVDFYPVP